MLGGEKTSQQDRASCSLKTNIWEWTVRQLNIFLFLFSIIKASSLDFSGYFFTVSWSQLIWPLSFSPRPEYTLSLYSFPQMMEINSHKRSGPLWQAEPPARGSSDPFEQQTKAKDFCPLCLLLKSHWKSAHAFFNLCHSSFIDALFFGEGDRQGDVLAWRRVRDGNGVGPLDKTFSFFLSLFPFYFYFWHY